jgi:hypothetical protein
MRINFYVTFDNVYDEVDPLLTSPNTKIPLVVPEGRTQVWNFDHIKNMKLYSGIHLNHSVEETGQLPFEFINASFEKDDSKSEINLILRLLSSNLNFNQLSMRATFNNCAAGTRFFLIKPLDMDVVYNYYIDLYNATHSNFARRARLFGPGAYTETDIKEAINGACVRADHFFTTSGAGPEGYFTADTYQTNSINQISNLSCRAIIKGTE